MPGHKADFGVIMAGPDLRGVHDVQMSIQASVLGPCCVPSYSFYSITEISEYVPDAEQYGQVLRDREGLDPESSIYKTKVAAYADRLGPMNKQRLYPEFPGWPCLCFYPMSKMCTAEQNWYLLPFEARSELMSYHARSGIKFAGKVSQLITASTGLDNWEWASPSGARIRRISRISSTRCGSTRVRPSTLLFGDFYFGYILPPDELLEAIRL